MSAGIRVTKSPEFEILKLLKLEFLKTGVFTLFTIAEIYWIIKSVSDNKIMQSKSYNSDLRFDMHTPSNEVNGPNKIQANLIEFLGF